jgi:putative transposase
MEAVSEAIRKYGKPEIFNTDQGCQFTSAYSTETGQAFHGKVDSRSVATRVL